MNPRSPSSAQECTTQDIGLILTELALSLALRGFEVFDDELSGQQTVAALIGRR